MKDGRGRAIAVAVLMAVLTGCGGSVTGEPQVSSRPVSPSPRPGATTSLDRRCSPPTPEATPAPAPDDVKVHNWPTTTRNPAGVYSWDATEHPGNRVEGFMHNGYSQSPTEVSIFMKGVPGELTPHSGQCAVTVAGYEGTYRRLNDQREEWLVDIEGTTIAIRLAAELGTSKAELAEAYAIIGSMRMQPRDNELGFRLVFTIPTNDWDSG